MRSRPIFCCSERDSIRPLHKFGAVERDNALPCPGPLCWPSWSSIRAGSTYRRLWASTRIAKHLSAARAETAARSFVFRVGAIHLMPDLKLIPGHKPYNRLR